MPLVANEICKAHGFTLDDIESWGGEVSYFRRLPGARLPDIEKGEADAIFDEAVRQWVDPGAALGMRFLEPEDEALAKLEALGMRRGVVLRSRLPPPRGRLPGGRLLQVPGLHQRGRAR